MDRDVLSKQLEDILAGLDLLSIELEKSGQWDPHAKVQRVVTLVKKLIGERNGIQSPSET